jgi:predicted DNA-binding protein (MmcQ/YjbR family)
MMTTDEFRELALSLPGAEEKAHFDRAAFRTKKRIFATMVEKEALVCLMLSEIEQSVFTAFDKTIIYPVPNKWGQKGATYVELSKVKKSVLKDALKKAYERSLV